MEEPKHQTITTVTIDGEEYIQVPASVIRNTKSYHEALGSIREVQVKRKLTGESSFLSDLIDAVDVIKKRLSHEVTISITSDEYYNPRLITKEYLTKSEDYKTKRR